MNHRQRNVVFSVERQRKVAHILSRVTRGPSMTDGHLRHLVNQMINRFCRIPVSDRGHATRLNMNLLDAIVTEFTCGDLQSLEHVCAEKRAAFDQQKEGA